MKKTIEDSGVTSNELFLDDQKRFNERVKKSVDIGDLIWSPVCKTVVVLSEGHAIFVGTKSNNHETDVKNFVLDFSWCSIYGFAEFDSLLLNVRHEEEI